MPNIFELWKDGKLKEGTQFRIPIQERQFILPWIFTGEKDQTITTKDTIRDPGGSVPLTSCLCVSTGKLHNHCSQLLLIGEVLPIPVTLDAYYGAINGSIAINSVCAALLSIPNQLIASRSINLEHIENYKTMISSLGKYSFKPYWVDDYISIGNPGRSVSCGLRYICDEERTCRSGLCETFAGSANENEVRFGESYTNFIRPVYYVDIHNPALEMELKNDVWVIKSK